MNFRTLVQLILITATALPLYSQELKTSASNPEKETFSYFLSDVSYVSDAVFMGRRDSVAAPYLLPSIGYYDKSGFFADASLSYLLAADEGRIDLILASAGYIASGTRWSGGIQATAYFFNDDSYNVQSETAASLSGMLGYDWKVLETQVTLNGYFGAEDGSDLFMGFTLLKDFKDKAEHWLLRPQASVYAGSQYFYQAYYNTSRLGNRKSSGTGQGSGITTSTNLVIDEASSFQILNIEFGLPIHYFQKHFIFSVSPYLSLPQSPATVSGADMDYVEELEPVFYLSAGLSFWW